MFRKIGCPNCQKNYDDALQECPFCGEKNAFVKQTKGSKATFLPFWKQILLAFVGSFGFQLIGLVVELIVAAVGMGVYGYTSDNIGEFLKDAWAILAIDGIAYLLLFGFLLLIAFKDNIKLLKPFKNWKSYVAGGVGFMAIMAFNVTFNLILTIFNVQTTENNNQSILNLAIMEGPIICIIMFGIIGPICEELTYRVGLFSFFRRINKYLAYAVTILVFAFIHFDFECFGKGTLVNELLNMPFYLFAGFTFTFL